MMQQDVCGAIQILPSEGRMIGEDFLRARFVQDWDEFTSRGRAVVARQIPKNNRQDFRDAFLKLEKEGCHADVLFPCLYMFLNSRERSFFSWSKALKFPPTKDLRKIRKGLQRVRKKMEALMNESGVATLTVGTRREFDLDFEEYSSFEKVHGDLLGTMDLYNGALEDLCRVLPARRDVVRQYGQAAV
jgi:hypothetical protein